MHNLFIAGCGIKFLSHMTLEVQALIKKCDSVLFLVNDPAMKKWIIDNSVKSLSLDSVYFGCQERKDSYKFICQEIIKSARTHRNTCFVTYGNPMFLSNASQQLIEDIGVMPDIQIKILPGISSLDTLFCDLGVDPGMGGLQAFEATNFINNNNIVNPSSHLVLWQIGVAGIETIVRNDDELADSAQRKEAVIQIKEKLMSFYTAGHRVILYTASMYPSVPFEKVCLSLGQLDKVNISRLSTAYIPPI